MCRESDETKGKIKTRKMLTMKEVTICKFMSDFYLSTFEKFMYHIHNVKILSKKFCWAKRRTTFMCKPGSLLTVWDYAERLSAHFDLEIQSDHFGNERSLLIEGCSVEVSMNNSFSLSIGFFEYLHLEVIGMKSEYCLKLHLLLLLDIGVEATEGRI